MLSKYYTVDVEQDWCGQVKRKRGKLFIVSGFSWRWEETADGSVRSAMFEEAEVDSVAHLEQKHSNVAPVCARSRQNNSSHFALVHTRSSCSARQWWRHARRTRRGSDRQRRVNAFRTRVTSWKRVARVWAPWCERRWRRDRLCSDCLK